jgi:hypothetical protein
MFFDDDESEKKLFEDIQFKRRVAFVDDDNVINIDLKPFSKISQRYLTMIIMMFHIILFLLIRFQGRKFRTLKYK